jgi:hypothetical protein
VKLLERVTLKHKAMIFHTKNANSEKAFKGAVQRKLRWVKSSSIDRYIFSVWSLDIFFCFRGPHPLNCKKPVSAAQDKKCGLSISTGLPLQIADSG